MTDGDAEANRYTATLGAARPVLSIVLPAYNESGNIQEIYSRLTAALESLQLTWEIIVADDGSRDDTWNEIVALHRADPRVKGIQLARNFGHQFALFAGLRCACGD